MDHAPSAASPSAASLASPATAAPLDADPFDDAALQPVDPAYVHVLRIESALTALPMAAGLTAADWLAVRAIDGPVGLLTALGWFAALTMILLFPARRITRIGYRLGSDSLRVARGWLVRVDTIVPFVRVQHIDVGQGPFERGFGLAHLTVHTSGTHNSVVTLPGLPRAEAEAMREVIRRHIQTDFA